MPNCASDESTKEFKALQPQPVFIIESLVPLLPQLISQLLRPTWEWTHALINMVAINERIATAANESAAATPAAARKAARSPLARAAPPLTVPPCSLPPAAASRASERRV